MREHVPFGRWLMAIDHPYSLGVKDGGLFWSCGQCPLDRSAKTAFPGDLPAQVRFTADLIRTEFASAGVGPDTLAKLVLYFADDGRPFLASALAAAHDVLGPKPLIVPIGVPHFYYEGMLCEIDVYAGGEPTSQALVGEHGGARLRAVRSGRLVHAVVTAEGTSGPGALAFYRSASLANWLDMTLHPFGVNLRGVLSPRVFVARQAGQAGFDLKPDGNPICPDPGAVIVADMSDGLALTADLVLVADSGDGARSSAAPISFEKSARDLQISAFEINPFLCVQGRVDHNAAASMSLAEQTHRIMEGLGERLIGRGYSFADVMKQQAHYVGSASPEDLYDNMRVRNRYYAKPGPASTGLPVHGFLADRTAISIELLLRR